LERQVEEMLISAKILYNFIQKQIFFNFEQNYSSIYSFRFIMVTIQAIARLIAYLTVKTKNDVIFSKKAAWLKCADVVVAFVKATDVSLLNHIKVVCFFTTS
jgi:hypothetical protein